jgi:hypothetical protein
MICVTENDEDHIVCLLLFKKVSHRKRRPFSFLPFMFSKILPFKKKLLACDEEINFGLFMFSCAEKMSVAGVMQSVGHRLRLARLRSNKSSADVAATLNFSNESQLADIEAGRSPLEKIGVCLGRLAVKYGVTVFCLVNPEGDGDSCGSFLKKLRLQSSQSISEVCRNIFGDCDEEFWLMSEKEMTLIEHGNHGTFERWVAVIKAFCLVVGVDIFAVVIGL